MKWTRAFSAALTVVLVLLAVCTFTPSVMAQSGTAGVTAGSSYSDFRQSPTTNVTNKAMCWELTQLGGPVTCQFNIGNKAALQGLASVPNTGTTDLSFGATSSILINPNEWVAGKTLRVRGYGRYTNAAASLLSLKIKICQVANCASGTVVSPAGCNVISTNQANNLTNGQFSFDCSFMVATVGATTAGTVWAKEVFGVNLGAATTAAQSYFQDTSTAVSAGFDTTVNEFITPFWTYATSNAGNSEILDFYAVDWTS